MTTSGRFDFSNQSVGAASVADQPTSNSQGGGIFDRAVLLSLEISKLGIRRKVAPGAVTTDADKDMINVSKAILESDKLDEIGTHDGQTRLWLSHRSLPSQFRSGIYLLPVDLVPDVDAYLVARQEQRNGLVDAFMDEYRLAIEAARGKLGSLYNPLDYPNEAKVRESFGLAYQWLEFSTPGRLRGISTAMFERERLKAENVWHEAINEAQELLRGEMASLVDHMVDRLKPGADGKKRIFRDSLVSNLREFLDLFAPRNIADDADLASVVERCKSILGNDALDSETLRTNETVRARVTAGMETIKSELDTMIRTSGRRNIEVADDWGDV